jgi:hypothetical protein
MTKLVHPSEALFKGEKQFPVIPSCGTSPERD